ncbi:hypothetical protein D3C87_1456150 [compost metagenome]
MFPENGIEVLTLHHNEATKVSHLCRQGVVGCSSIINVTTIGCNHAYPQLGLDWCGMNLCRYYRQADHYSQQTSDQ